MGEPETVAEQTKEQESTEADLFTGIALEIENLQAEEAYETLMSLLETEGLNDFKVGGVMAAIQGNSLWKEYGTYESFKDFVVTNVGMEYRKAMYLINNYEALVEAGVKWEEVSDIGWSKLKEITSVINKENAAEWIDRAREHTVLQLQELVKQFKAGTLDSTEMAPEVSSVTSISFKVHEDQKETIKQAVAKAKGEADTEVDAVALEAVCMNYLSGATVKVPSLIDTMSQAGIQEVVNAMDAIWPDIDIQIAMPNPDDAEATEEIPVKETMDL